MTQINMDPTGDGQFPLIAIALAEISNQPNHFDGAGFVALAQPLTKDELAFVLLNLMLVQRDLVTDDFDTVKQKLDERRQAILATRGTAEE